MIVTRALWRQVARRTVAICARDHQIIGESGEALWGAPRAHPPVTENDRRPAHLREVTSELQGTERADSAEWWEVGGDVEKVTHAQPLQFS